MIRTILVPVRRRGLISSLALAADLARHFHAHADVVLVESDANQSSAGATERAETGQHETLNTDPHRVFQGWQSAHGFRSPSEGSGRDLASASFHDHSHRPIDLTRRAKLVDLVCVASPFLNEADWTGRIIEPVLFGSGRPILMVPIHGQYEPGSFLGASAVVGWNGTIEAVRAISTALPFLRLSSRVEVITVDEDPTVAADAYEMATYLASHGIIAAASGIGRKDWSGEDVIDVALTRAAGLLVMGARRYLGAKPLGGATSHVLAAKPLPVLMMA